MSIRKGVTGRRNVRDLGGGGGSKGWGNGISIPQVSYGGSTCEHSNF